MLLGTQARRRAAALGAQQLRGLSVGAVHQALPVPVQDEQTGGWLAQLFGSRGRQNTPMSEPLPGVQLPTPFTPPSSAPATESTKLSNGLVIASENTPGPTATLGLYVNAGSSYERTGQTGVAHLLEYMAFKATQNRTHFRLVREAEAIGANTLASASREQMVYTVDVVKTNVAEALELLADAVFNPKFQPWDVKAQREKLVEDLKAFSSKPQTAILEGLHEVAWTGGLSRPLICPTDAANGLNSQALLDFHREHYVPGKVVLAGAGISQEELTSLAKPLLESIPGGKAPAAQKSAYVGGDFRQFAAGDTTHVMLAFELQGGWKDIKTAVTATVLQFLLGGGGSFSSGGPGKGMHSRLYRRVLNKYGWMQNCSAFNSLYDSTGIAGISATLNSANVGQGIDVMSKELLAVAKDPPAEEVERAKMAAVSAILINLESRAVANEDIGRQILTYGHRKPIKEFTDLIRGVKPSDISSLVSKMVKTPLSLACLGDIAAVPRYNAVQSHFG